MKGDTILDLVVFQLTAPRTRCELFVSADGMIEKLASGFLKPFLNHLRAVEEQVAGGCESVRLERPETYHGRSWFTKGTLERFVRFVSTPEVLERVKSIEDELGQLEQVRNIQAGSLPQVEDPFLGADPIYPRKGSKAFSGQLGKSGGSKLPSRYPYDAVDSSTEASKVELLRAMDVRLLALRQEQGTAFGRAAAAGFNCGNMTDLMAFSEYFGADRLRVACVNFLIVSQRRIVEPAQLNPWAILPNAEHSPQLSVRVSESNQAHLPYGSHYFEEGKTLLENDGLMPAPTEVLGLDGLLSRGAGGMEARKRWGPPENIRTKLFGDQIRIDSSSSNGNLVDHSLEAQSINKKAETGFLKTEKENVEGSSWSLENDGVERQAHIMGEPAQDKGMMLKDTGASESQVAQKVAAPHEPDSPKERSSCTGGRIDTGGSPFGPETVLHTTSDAPSSVLPNKQTTKPNATHIEEDNNPTKSPPVSAPARRLSVQAAISLFEDKKRRELVEAPGKSHLGKQENGRTSMEGSNASVPGSMASRRRSTPYGAELGKVLQENQVSSKQEAVVTSSESLPSEAASFTSRGTGDVLLPRQGQHAVEPQSRAFLKASNTTFQQQCPTIESSGKLSDRKEQVLADSLCKTQQSEFQAPVRLNPGKSKAQETLGRDLPVMQGPSKLGSNLMMTRTNEFFDSESGGTDPSAKPEMIESRSREPEIINLSTGPPQVMLMQDSSMPQNPSLEIDQLALSTAYPEKEQAVSKEKHRKDATTKVYVNSERSTTQSDGMESFGSSRVISPHFDMQIHVRLDVNQKFNDDDDSTEHRGRFYEQYRKLRDAKMMEEIDSKRAGREAKLRFMEETMLLRKAEFDAQAMRQSKNNNHQARAAKLQARKADLYGSQRTKEDGGDERYGETSSCSIGRSISPPFTPIAGKEEASTSKSLSGRKTNAVSRKGATPPRSSIRGTSVSPKLTPLTSASSTTKPRKSAASSVTDNPLAKSVPSFANLRKENTKPFSGRPSGNAGLQAKDGGSGRFRAVSEVLPLEANVNVLVSTPPPGNGPAKEDKVHGSSLVRKSYANLKTLSTASDDGVSAPPKVQREVGSEPPALSKSKRNGASPFQEAGTGLGLGMCQQLPLPTVETTNGANEEKASITPPLESDKTNDANKISEEIQGTIYLKDVSEEENMDIDEADFSSNSGPTNSLGMQLIATAYALGEEAPEGPQLDAWCVTENVCRTIFFPTDIDNHKLHAAESRLDLDPSPSKEPSLIQELNSDPQSQFEDVNGDALQSRYVISASRSFRASSLPHEHHLPVFSRVTASPPSSRVAQVGTFSGHMSPSSATTLKSSPFESPAYWNSSQSGAELTQLDRKLAGPQKLAMGSTKDPVKGFKRLLNFARKNRALDSTAADWASSYMMSEVDDESEDQRLSTDELTAKGSLEERKIIDTGGEQYSTPDQVSAAQFLRSSIPTPPANFRLRNDHLMGGTMLKAPKSFFSLSSFRNKATEGRAR